MKRLVNDTPKARPVVPPFTLLVLGLCLVGSHNRVTAQVPDRLKPWLAPQPWERDTDGPILSLGKPGEFDDTHIFGPMVAVEGSRERSLPLFGRPAKKRGRLPRRLPGPMGLRL